MPLGWAKQEFATDFEARVHNFKVKGQKVKMTLQYTGP